MKPLLMFAKSPPPGDAQPLVAETQHLRNYLQNAKPAALEALEEAYRSLREKRAEQRKSYQQACAQHREVDNAAQPSAHMNQLEATIRKLDDEIGTVREKVGAARAAWLPKYRAQLKLHLNAADAALAEATDLIEAAARLHHEADKFGLANGLNVPAVPRSRRLADLASTLRRFVKVREQK